MTRITTLTALVGLLTATPALACDCFGFSPGRPADFNFPADNFPVIAEGVLEFDGKHAWRLRPTHEYRGSNQASYLIFDNRCTQFSDCSLSLEELQAFAGKPIFVVLSQDRAGNRYYINRCAFLRGSEFEKAVRQRITGNDVPR